MGRHLPDRTGEKVYVLVAVFVVAKGLYVIFSKQCSLDSLGVLTLC